MDKVSLVGTVASAVTIAYTCCGLPLQIVKNYRSRSTAGLSLFMMGLAFLTLLCWVVYALVKVPRDWFILVSNAPGALFALVILAQCVHYRRRKEAA